MEGEGQCAAVQSRARISNMLPEFGGIPRLFFSLGLAAMQCAGQRETEPESEAHYASCMDGEARDITNVTLLMACMQGECDLVKLLGVQPSIWMSIYYLLSVHSRGLPMCAFFTSACYQVAMAMHAVVH